jgi:hypothetical protein
LPFDGMVGRSIISGLVGVFGSILLLHVNIANLQWHSLGIHCLSPVICRFMAIPSSSDDKPGTRRRRRATTSLRSLWGFVSTVKAGALGPGETPLKRAATACPLSGWSNLGQTLSYG